MLSRAEHVARLMEVNGCSRKAAETQVTRLNVARRNGARLLRAGGPKPVGRTRPEPEPRPEPAKRPYRRAWTRCPKIYLRSMLIDRSHMNVYRGSDGTNYSQAMLEESVALGHFKIVSRRKTKSGHTVTVLSRKR